MYVKFRLVAYNAVCLHGARSKRPTRERKRSRVDFTCRRSKESFPCRRPNVLLDSGPSPVSSCHVPSHRRAAREAGGQGGGGDGAIRGRDRFQAWHVGRRPHGRALWQARRHGRGARILFVSSRPRSDGAAREGAAGGGTPVARCINIRRTRRRSLLARATQYRRLVHLGACASRSHGALCFVCSSARSNLTWISQSSTLVSVRACTLYYVPLVSAATRSDK